MLRRMFKSKIHRATVTQADINYEGSVSIDLDLMERADILPYEEVHVWNVTNGQRFITYAIEGDRDSGTICVNGAAARLVAPGDLVIIASFAEMEEERARKHEPINVFVDGNNRVKTLRKEIAGPRLVASN